ncbi:PREDICTED: BTB/POZ domain-containing protein At5g17580-like [Tarenaya hassleriana]|uniref:BTB/POZ domain-containing protein At5g17580-like n=1 Tax=Tarenaya hassleriana TaxID=28532 RepID=UPI00053C4820|nr:PREDICTED: BTB/POZ domain-containing protein At5g17580-like [Tarenaya hassleriana]
MNDQHGSDNLLNKAAAFLERDCEISLSQVEEIGLLNVFLESLVEMAVNDPRLLGEPIRNNNCEAEEEKEGDDYRPNPRRRLFVLDRKSEDLITVPLQLYESLIRAMDAQNVPTENLVSSICKYAKRWVFEEISGDKNFSFPKRECHRKAIEAVEQLLPHQREAVPCTFLSELLKQSILLEASSSCRDGFEVKVGKQLDMATAKDLLIISNGYPKRTSTMPSW